MSVSIRELRNQGGEVVDRVSRGERVTITRSGVPVAELRPVARTPSSAEVLLAHWHRLPKVDPTVLRDDIEKIMNTRL